MKRHTLSIGEFCAFVGIRRSTWYAMRDRDECPPVVRMGRRVVILRETAEKWLSERQVAA